MRILRCIECDSERIVVTMREHNRSAFAGYRVTPSRWSELTCLHCRRRWRSRAAAVDRLPDEARDDP